MVLFEEVKRASSPKAAPACRVFVVLVRLSPPDTTTCPSLRMKKLFPVSPARTITSPFSTGTSSICFSKLAFSLELRYSSIMGTGSGGVRRTAFSCTPTAVGGATARRVIVVTSTRAGLLARARRRVSREGDAPGINAEWTAVPDLRSPSRPLWWREKLSMSGPRAARIIGFTLPRKRAGRSPPCARRRQKQA